MEFKAFNLTVQGASHIKKNRECQDASKSFFCADYGIAVVCDGHGGEDYIRSAIGSEMASQIALDNIKEFILQVDKDYLRRHFDELLYSLEGSIISMWRDKIRNHWECNPITEEEKSRLSDKAIKRYLINGSIASAYGTTLIAVVVTKNYWFCFQVGDGRCVWIDKNSYFDQLKLDDKCFLNATTSLCDSNALEHFHDYYSEEIPPAVFVGSDGIDDCFKNNEQLYNFYKTICYSFGTTDIDQAVAELNDFLPRLSKKGSGDDVSIASVLNMDLLPSIDAVTRFNRDNERAKKQKSEEEEAKKNAKLIEDYQRKSEEELLRNNTLRLRKEVAENTIKMVKVIQDLDDAMVALNNARSNLEKAEEEKNVYLKKLQETTMDKCNQITKDDYEILCNIFQEKNEYYIQCLHEHQNALGKFNKTKIIHDGIIRSIGAKCPNPQCNELNLASAKFCSKCGTAMNADLSNFEICQNDILIEKNMLLNSEASCAEEVDKYDSMDEFTKNTDSNIAAEKVTVMEDKSILADNEIKTEDLKSDVEKEAIDDKQHVTCEKIK